MKYAFRLILVVSIFVLTVGFQNCGQVAFNTALDSSNKMSGGPIPICNGVSCTLTPLTDKAMVTTILLALGDQANSELVINGASAQLIAETVVRYSSPVNNPRILEVLDPKNQGESPEDAAYVHDTLLKRYNVTSITAATSGLTPADVAGYDIVWYNNPGYPMSSQQSLSTLLAFTGAVILQGDDLAHGSENGTAFSLSALTGLSFIDNGTSIDCHDGHGVYSTDNNAGELYRVTLDSSKITAADNSVLSFHYGNDIDNSSIISGRGVEVIAYAQGNPSTCVEQRPTITRRVK